MKMNLRIVLMISASLLTQHEALSCPEGYFSCGNNRQCVKQEFICDGRTDCENGSDEGGCPDESLIKFWNSFYRKRPDEDREKKVERCEHIKGCTCAPRGVYCVNLELKQVPENISSNVQDLDLSGNFFHSLRVSTFPMLTELAVLRVAYSGIQMLDKNVFRNLPNLEKVYLTGNELSHIGPRAFETSVTLEELDLSHNPITVLFNESFTGLVRLRELDLRNCSIRDISVNAFADLKRLNTLWLDFNQIEEFSKPFFHSLEHLQTLSISRNKIFRIEYVSFQGLRSLQLLNLGFNHIEVLEDAFNSTPELQKLDLSGNQLNALQDNIFLALSNLQSLYLKENPLQRCSPKVFAPLRNLTHLYFSDFTYCSLAFHVRVCEPRGDGISSLVHLLDSCILRVSVWVVALIACFGNMLVLISRIIFKEQNQVHSFYIKNLALADFIMGIYLISIAFHDMKFRGDYIRFDYTWRHSWQCSLSGVLSTVSSEASVFILTVITVDRFISIMYPLSVKKRTFKYAVLCMVSVWIFSVLLAVIPLLTPGYYGEDFYGSNGVCLPLHVHKPFARGWEYSMFIFCTINSIAFIFIAYSYSIMFFTITNSKIGLRSTQQLQDRAVAKRFAFIVGTDFMCWMPIAAVKIFATAGATINETLYAWVAVFLLPVNSALNPVLYTLTTKLFKQQFGRLFTNVRRGSKRSTNDPLSVQSWSSTQQCRNSKKTLITTLSDQSNGSNSLRLFSPHHFFASRSSFPCQMNGKRSFKKHSKREDFV